MMNRIIYLIFICFLFNACEEYVPANIDNLPSAIGENSLIEIVVDKKIWKSSKAGESLRNVFEEYEYHYPIEEPMFSTLIVYSDNFSKQYHKYKNIVIVKVGNEVIKNGISTQNDLWAVGQTITYIKAKSVNDLVQLLETGKQNIQDLFKNKIHSRFLSEAKTNYNEALNENIKKSQKLSFLLPGKAQIKKDEKDFIWIEKKKTASKDSDKGTNQYTIVESYLIYHFPYTDTSMLSTSYLLEKRDSIMKQYFRIFTPDAYIATTYPDENEIGLYPISKTFDKDGNYIKVIKGKWHSIGVTAGGTFSCRIFVDKTHRRVVVAEANLFAPGLDSKRNTLIEMESYLETIKPI